VLIATPAGISDSALVAPECNVERVQRPSRAAKPDLRCQQLDTPRDTELFQDVRNVKTGRSGADIQRASYLLVGLRLQKQLTHFVLSFSQGAK
jgi:hypothetical protein